MKVWIRRIDESMGTDTNGEGVSLNVFFAGCSKQPKCPKCHNPELWERDDVDEVDIKHLYTDIENTEAEGFITHIVFVGGEPLDQPKALFLAALKAK